MNWIDRNLQHEILTKLNNIYPEYKTYDYWIEAAMRGADEPFVNNLSANLHYLREHGLIVFASTTPPLEVTAAITAKGIDFLADDGGLSAILDVVIVKLHSDTIKTLIAAKIDQADISDDEKSHLRTELGKIKDTALSTLTENVINAINPTQLIALFRTAVGL